MTSWPAAATVLTGACVVAVSLSVATSGASTPPRPPRPAPPAGPVSAVGVPPPARPPVPALGAPAPAPRWGFPLVPRPVVLRPFSSPPGPYAAGHRGVDLAAVAGDVVRSPTEGTVVFAGSVAGRPVLVVQHAGGLRSTLEPVTAGVAPGTRVGRGDRVGAVAGGPGHCSPATCVHWGVLRGATYLDPLRFVGRARVVLLPVGPA